MVGHRLTGLPISERYVTVLLFNVFATPIAYRQWEKSPVESYYFWNFKMAGIDMPVGRMTSAQRLRFWFKSRSWTVVSLWKFVTPKQQHKYEWVVYLLAVFMVTPYKRGEKGTLVEPLATYWQVGQSRLHNTYIACCKINPYIWWPQSSKNKVFSFLMRCTFSVSLACVVW